MPAEVVRGINSLANPPPKPYRRASPSTAIRRQSAIAKPLLTNCMQAAPAPTCTNGRTHGNSVPRLRSNRTSKCYIQITVCPLLPSAIPVEGEDDRGRFNGETRRVLSRGTPSHGVRTGRYLEG